MHVNIFYFLNFVRITSIYFNIGGGEVFTPTSKYFYAHPKIDWVATTLPEAVNIPGIINVLNNGDNQWVVRQSVAYQGKYYQQVGTYSVNGAQYSYWDGTALKSDQTYVEVLVCLP